MKSCFFVLILVLGANSLKACGGPHDDTGCYHIFSFLNISNHDYLSYATSFKFPSDYTGKLSKGNEGNIKLWKKYFNDPKWTAATIENLLESYNAAQWKNKNTAAETAANKYFKFAHECSSNFKANNSWDYNTIIRKNYDGIAKIAEAAYKNYQQEKNLQLKQRYAYQFIRILRYSRQFSEAIKFFRDQIEEKYEKNEIYYYTLDQIGGCYYQTNDKEKAAYMFLSVFDKSIDRKKSAAISYSFCTQNGFSGTKHFTKDSDHASRLALIYLRNFSDEVKGIEEFYKIKPEDERLELLYIRIFYDLERSIFPNIYGNWKQKLPYVDKYQLEKMEKMLFYAEKNIHNPKIKNKEFWLLSASYLNFLSGKTEDAFKLLDQVTHSKYSKQVNILRNVYTVFSWNSMNYNNEIALSRMLAKYKRNSRIDADKYFVSYYDCFGYLSEWENLVMAYVGHLYIQDDKLAKSYLIHNSIYALASFYNLQLINDMTTFIDKKDKNVFENRLMQQSGITQLENPKHYIKTLKANYFLMNGNPIQALEVIKNVDFNKSKKLKLIDARVFSNNISEKFTDEEYNFNVKIMKDSVYLAKMFKFIPLKMNLKQLAQNLIKLDSLSKVEKRSTRKLASYLLGNYYLNLSNTGAFRNVLISQESPDGFHGYYFGYRGERLSDLTELIKSNQLYNMLDLGRLHKKYFGLAKTAMEYYQNARKNSDDKELNARITYMMAKCELNTMFNENLEYSEGYDGKLDNITKKYKSNFSQLKNEYKDTRFYKKIIKECSFFRYYAQN